MRFWIFAFLILALSCSSNSSPKKQVLHINIQGEPQSLDPRKARDLNAVALMHMLFEGLTRVGKDGSTELALAKSVEVSEDGLCYTFQLRDALWSNGSPVTSYDFAKSWLTSLDPSFPTDMAFQLFVIKGAKSKKLDKTTGSVGIQTPDSQTLVVELEQPIPYFLELLTFPSFFPIFSILDEKNPHWMEDPTNYVSNGPFVLHQWNHSDEIRVQRNPCYWDAKSIHLKEIAMVMVSPETELRMFKDGLLDWAGSPLSTLPGDSLAKLKESQALKMRPLTGTYFLRVNTSALSPLSDLEMRRALALAIDRQKIAEHILQGGHCPAKALVPPVMGLSTTGYFNDASVSEAKKLFNDYLERTGMQLKDFPPLTLTYSNGERNHLIAQTLQQQITESLGVPILLEAVERKMYYQRISAKEYQLAAGSWIADFNDPINFLEVFKFKEGSSNNTGWENPKYVERLNSTAVCRNREERIKILREAEQLLMEQMPLIPIYHFTLNYLQQSAVQDVSLSPIGQIDFRWCHLEEELSR